MIAVVIRTVDVPVGDFFFGWLAQVDHRDVKSQLFPGQGMVEIELDGIIADIDDAGIHGMPFTVPNLEIGSRLKRNGRWELGAWYVDNGARIHRTIPNLRYDGNILGFAFLHALDFPLQPTDDLPVSLDKLNRSGLFRAVDELPF